MLHIPEDSDNTESGLERLAFGAFFRKYNKFRTSDVAPRFIPFPEDMELPQGSLIHILDNMYSRDNGLTLKDTPNLNFPLIKNERFRKFVYHVVAPNVTDPENPIVLPSDYVYRTMQLNQNLMRFRKEMGSKIRYVTNLEAIPATPSTLTILNYNPLFRVFTRGILPVYRQFKVILGTVLNTAAKIENKTQYIVIPLSHQIYPRDKFRMTEKKETTSTIKSPNSFHYFFMIHWLNFISTLTDLSLFESYPKEKWQNTNIIFTVGTDNMRHAMIWSLHDATRLNEKNKLYPRYVNQINVLVLNNMGIEVSDSEDTETEINKITVDKHIPTETRPAELVTQNPEENKSNLPELTEDEIQEIKDDSLEKTIVEMFTEKVPLSVDEVKPIAKTIVPVNYSNLTVNIDDIPSAKIEEIPTLVDTSDTTEIAADKSSNGEAHPVTPIKHASEIAESGKRYLDVVDKELDKVLKANQNLTQKQKERITKLAQASKSIKFNGKTVEQILTEPVNPNPHGNKLEFLKDQLPDTSMLESSVQNFDDVYMKNFFERDLVSIGLSMNKNGMILKGIEEQIHSDELNRIRKFKFAYEDLNGKSHTVKFDVPHIDEDGICLVNGIKCVLRKQMANLPICKVSATRVSLASNYNKTVVERNVAKAHSFLAYFQRLINKINSDATKDNRSRPPIDITYGTVKINDKISYEYGSLATTYSALSVRDSEGYLSQFTFDYHNRFSGLPAKYVEPIKTLESTHGTYLGVFRIKSKDEATAIFFIHPNNIITLYDLEEKKELHKTTFIDMFTGIFKTELSSPLSEWTDIKILDKKFPIGFLLCYQFGIMHTLKYLGIKYQIYERRKRYEKRASDIVINFQDKLLVIPRYPLRNSLIMSGLLMFDTSKYLLEELDFKDVYYQLLVDKGPGFRTNYLKGIEDTFALFVDPITHDVLEQMNEPTTFKDLLIRATDMLVTEAHVESSSMANHRLRSYERINGILYNEMSRQYAAFHRKSGGGTQFSINPNSVMQRILQDQAMAIVEDINPIHEIKINTGFTYSGTGGRTSQSFVINDRRYPKDATGIISESTPDSQSVAISAIMSANPTIANIRGILDNKDIEELDPSQLLSTTSLLMPGATHDDPKRANFISIQLSHQLPTKEGECFRIRTGYERVIAHRSSSMYSYPAILDGKVLQIDDNAQLCKIQYSDGSIHTFPFGEIYGECADMVTTQKLNLTVSVGESFKKGDILSYNPQFFEFDSGSKQADWKHGVSANVAIMDCAGTYEDSNIITQELGNKLEIEPVQIRSIEINANTFIHNIKKVGDHVDINDYLVVFEDATMTDMSSISSNEETLDYLAKLNRVTPKAKFTGEIVKVEAYYSLPLTEMHQTLGKIVKDIIRLNNIKNKFSQGTSSSAQYPLSQPLPEGTKFKKVTFDKDTVVLRFFIKELITAGVGDKIVFDSSLKSVVGVVTNDTPETESGIKVDAVFSGSSISNRIVNSPMLVGIGERVLERLEESVLDIYFGK